MKPTVAIQSQAAHRVALKHIIHAARGTVKDEDATTRQLESQVRTIAKTAPALVAHCLDDWFRLGALAWERGNNSGDNETMEQMDARCDRIRARSELVLAMWGVKVDYPGLYPSFEWAGHTYHDATTLMRDIAERKPPTA